MKTRPGAMKRKEKLERMERDRFQKNLAQMAAGPPQNGGTGNAIQDRWAALKSHVENNTERKAEFVGK